MYSEKLAGARKAEAEARLELNEAEKKFADAENTKAALVSQTSEASKAVASKSKALDDLKKHLDQLITQKNSLTIFKRKERKILEGEKIPDANRKIQAGNTELAALQERHRGLSQSLSEAEKDAADLRGKVHNQQERLKSLSKEITLAELELRTENGEDNAQYQLTMLHFNEGRKAKAKQLAAKPGTGYSRAGAEIAEIENEEMAKAREEEDLKEIRDVTAELISLYNYYKTVGRSDLVSGIDDKIHEAKDNLNKAEAVYKATPIEDKEQIKSAIRELLNITKEAVSAMKQTIEYAEERKRNEDLLHMINSNRPRWGG